VSKRSRNRQAGQQQALPVPPPPSQPFGQISVSASAHQVSYTSPFPPPEVLEQYEHVYPGAVERILSLVEVQAAHRRDLEQRNVRSTIRRAYIGQASALIIGLTGFAAVIIAILNDQPLAAGVLGVADIGSLVSIYLKGSSQQAQERRTRLQALMEKMGRGDRTQRGR
jgi:uncharacterized membrane protein